MRPGRWRAIGGIEFERAQFGGEQVAEGLPIRFFVDFFLEGDGDVFSTDSFEPQCVANFDSSPTGESGLVVHEGAGVALLVDELFVLEALEYPIDEVGVDVGGAEFLLEISPTGFASSAVGTGTTIE